MLVNVCVTAADTHTTLLPATSPQICSGQVAVLRGENGAGKTTLLSVLAGRTAPTSGSARICGLPTNERDTAFRRRLAAMIGLPPMAPDLTVLEHVALIAATWHRDPAKAKTATNGVLAELGLSPLAARFPSELSSGQTQLLGLAMVLVRPFAVLLLDEPEQRLDPARITLLAKAIMSRRLQGAAVVVATHSEMLAELIADQTILLAGAK